MPSFFSHLFVIRSARHLWVFAIATTAALVAVAVGIDAIINSYFSPERMWASLLQTSLMAAAIGSVFIFMAARANYRLYIAQREFERLSLTDFQTGLLNRRGFFAEVERSIDDRTGSYLLIADIDHFKRINDKFGHIVGDGVIAAVGTALRDDFSVHRICGRVGGEEFGIVLLNVSDSDALMQAGHVRWRIMKGISRASLPTRGVTVSIGLCGMAGRSLTEAYALTDKALYRAKRAGRNCCVMATGDQDPNSPDGHFRYSGPQEQVG
jgi:diguanylate cyclase (GGDEF)-like protein